MEFWLHDIINSAIDIKACPIVTDTTVQIIGLFYV